MVTRVCGYSSEELIAIGFTKKEVAKWQRIASRYRRRQKPEPEPSAWVIRYRKKIANGWTKSSKKPDDIAKEVWVRYLDFASSHRVKNEPIPDVYAYVKNHMGNSGGANYKRTLSPKRRKIKVVKCHADIKAIAERCREIVAAKLREQGLSLPPKKLASTR